MADLSALVAELRALEEKATKAPWSRERREWPSCVSACDEDGAWFATGPGHDVSDCETEDDCEEASEADCNLIAAARNALPALLDALEAAQLAAGQTHQCVNCGKTKDAATTPREAELPECVGPDGLAACTFDMTPQEAVEFWREKSVAAQRALFDALNRERDSVLSLQARIATLEAALASGLEVCEVAKDMTFAPWAVHAKKLLAVAALRGGKETPGE